jgi:phospholipase/carboxylesterase
MLTYKSYILGNNPQNLVIFLHGYNGNPADHQYAVDWLKQYLQQSILVVPEAPEICDKNPEKKQWFGMLKYDAANRRSQPETTVAEIMDIYNAAASEITLCAQMLNEFISNMQQQFNIDNAHTYLIGFSQGAMLTIYTALTRPQKIAGGYVLSGLVAAQKELLGKITSKPPLCLLHGQDDMKVQYKTLEYSTQWLKNQQVPVRVYTYKGLAHRMNEDEIKRIAEEINHI